MAESTPKSALDPPKEILEELGEESDEYEDIEDEGEHEEGGYEDEEEEEGEQGDEEGGSSLTGLLLSSGKTDADADAEGDDDDDEDEEYQEPPTPTAGVKRAREDEGVRDTGDEKEGYVTDINEDTTEKDAKKPKI